MYSYLRGTYKGPAPEGDGAILLEAGGVGYEVLLPPIVEGEVVTTCSMDEPLLLYVSAQSGRDQPWPVLFGFLRPEQKAFWELLKSVPRVGGKGAARAMIVPIDQIATAIQQGNRAFLDGLPGVTVDGADKMIASLRKKVGPFVEVADGPTAPRAPRGPVDDVRDDAVMLLTQMGLKRLDAARAVNSILGSRDDITSVQDIVTEYLRQHREGRAR
jgi:Holliday junction resolvasome RuvABC DNA-binding subunit